MRVRRVCAGLVAGVLVAGLAGCGDEEAEPAPEPESTNAAVPVELRLVLATSREPAPDSLVLQQFGELDCAAPPRAAPPQQATAACDAAGIEYSLEPAAVVGGIESADASADAGDGPYVEVALDDEAAAALAELTGGAVPGTRQVAVVLDGQVLAAPTVQQQVTDGRLQIVGGLTDDSARALADRLAGRLAGRA
jgi:preprotein translocase subunit SecD